MVYFCSYCFMLFVFLFFVSYVFFCLGKYCVMFCSSVFGIVLLCWVLVLCLLLVWLAAGCYPLLSWFWVCLGLFVGCRGVFLLFVCFGVCFGIFSGSYRIFLRSFLHFFCMFGLCCVFLVDFLLCGVCWVFGFLLFWVWFFLVD